MPAGDLGVVEDEVAGVIPAEDEAVLGTDVDLATRGGTGEQSKLCHWRILSPLATAERYHLCPAILAPDGVDSRRKNGRLAGA